MSTRRAWLIGVFVGIGFGLTVGVLISVAIGKTIWLLALGFSFALLAVALFYSPEPT